MWLEVGLKKLSAKRFKDFKALTILDDLLKARAQCLGYYLKPKPGLAPAPVPSNYNRDIRIGLTIRQQANKEAVKILILAATKKRKDIQSSLVSNL